MVLFGYKRFSVSFKECKETGEVLLIVRLASVLFKVVPQAKMTCLRLKILYMYGLVASVQIYCSYLSKAEEHHKYVKHFVENYFSKRGGVVLFNFFLRFCQLGPKF